MLRAVVALVLALGTSACSWFTFGTGSTDDAETQPEASERTGLAAEADQLLEADRALAAKVLELGAAAAYRKFFDEQGTHVAAAGEPVTGADAIRAAMAAGPARVLSLEPRYAEVFAPGNWGWTWGEWQAHEPGAGGRRMAQGHYVNIWKKQGDGSWKVRADLRSPEAAP